MPLSLPKYIDPASGTLALTPGTYSDLVQGELGNLGTPTDGMDDGLFAMGVLSATASPLLDALTGALASVPPSYLSGPETGLADLASGLTGASAAVDNDLTAYNGIIPPAAQPGGSGGGGAPPPAPSNCPGVVASPYVFQASDFPGITVSGVQTLQSPCSNGPTIYVDTQFGNAAHAPYYVQSATFIGGDQTMFSAQIFANQYAGTYTGDSVRVNFVPSRAGTFKAIVRVHYNPPGLADFIIGVGVVVRQA